MSKADLKAAMESLQVKKPLRLQGNQPMFKVPTPVVNTTLVVDTTQVETETMVVEVTPVVNTTQVSSHTQAVKTTPVLNTTLDLDTPQVLDPTQVADATKVVNPTQVGACQEFPSSQAHEQDSSVTLEAQVSPKLSSGYTRIPNHLLMAMVSGDMSRNEMKLLLLIARFTISFQRKYAPLSKAVIERQCGIGGPAVLLTISGLVENGLVEKIAGDKLRPNQLGLVGFDDFFQAQKSVTPVVDTTLVENPPQVLNTTPAPVVKTTKGEVVKTTYFKDNIKYSKKSSLSQFHFASEKIGDYFSSVTAPKKRETEIEAYRAIREGFNESEIEIALLHVQQFGTLGDQMVCHSPMAYLSAAIGDVLRIVRDKTDMAAKLQNHQNLLLTQKQSQVDQEAAEDLEAAEREELFVGAYPSAGEQLAAIAKFSTRLPMLNPTGPAARSLAILDWWKANHE